MSLPGTRTRTPTHLPQTVARTHCGRTVTATDSGRLRGTATGQARDCDRLRGGLMAIDTVAVSGVQRWMAGMPDDDVLR